MSDVTYVPVLIVGGGISGLSAAAFLAYHEVGCMLLERRPTHSPHPRMTDVGPRSMELFRGLGLESRIRELDEGTESVIIRVKTLAGKEIERHSMGGSKEELSGISPTQQVWCDQDQLEPTVRGYAEQQGADIRFGAELLDFEQDADRVRARVRDRVTGSEYVVEAAYLLACDGIHSPVRDRLGIDRVGPGVFAHQAGILFRADLTAALRGRRFVLCLLDEPGEDGATGEDHLRILLRRNLGRWTLSVPYRPDLGQTPEDFTTDHCTELIRAAVGEPGLEVEVLDVDTWPMQALVATSFRSGRVFLVGDSSHALPPTGGFGGNSCIQDAHNLAWKLAAVLDGTATPGLLDSFDAERRPIAGLHLEESMARAGLFLAGAAEGGSEQPQDHPSKSSIALGYRYCGGAVVTEEQPYDCARLEDPREPSGRPGTRAPHIVVERAGRQLSTLDLFGKGFVLLAGPDGAGWRTAAAEVADGTGIGVAAYRLTAQRAGLAEGDLLDPHGAWLAAYGVTPSGAVVVRPDGFIAWRCLALPDQPAEALHDALTALLDQHQDQQDEQFVRRTTAEAR